MVGRASSHLLFLACSLALVGCAKPRASSRFISDELHKLIPPGATSLAGLDLNELRQTTFYRLHAAQFESPVVQSFGQQLGFDFRHDVSSLLLISTGKQAFIAVRGTFRQQFIEQQLAKSGKPSEHAGHKLFRIGSSALTVLNQNLALVGPPDWLPAVIELYENETGDLPAEFESSFEQLAERDQIWAVSRGGLPFAGIARRTDIASLLSNFAGYVESTSTGILIDSGLDLKARVDCVSLQGAKRVDDGMRGGIGLARLAARGNETDLLQAYDAMRVRKEDKAVLLDVHMPPTVMEAIMKRLEGLP